MVQKARSLPWALDPQHRERWLAPLRAGAALVFLDYDGTLTPIVDRPQDAALPFPLWRVLNGLASRCPVTIVTGRDVEVARELVGIERLGYAGSHGLDIVGPAGSGLRKEVARDWLDTLDAAEAHLRRALERIDGALVERKRFSIASHVRLVAPADRCRVRAAVARVATRFPVLRRERGKAVYELRPDLPWDKGAAVAWITREMGRDLDAVVYIGDDRTDEDAFELLGGAGAGAGIVVTANNRSTAARLRLADPGEVGSALVHMLGATFESSGPAAK